MSLPRFRLLASLIPVSLILIMSILSGCSSAPFKPDEEHPQIGMASWYGKAFQGRKTASGSPFDANKLTAAHRSLPFGTRLRVTNLSNRKSVIVTVTDRGPYAHDRIIDLSRKAARALGFVNQGTAKVRLDVLEGS